MPNDPAGFELRDHTADIALFVWGDTLSDLFISAASGLYATIGTLRASEECQPVTLSIRANAPEDLLRDFLTELHFRFETQGVLLTSFVFSRMDDQSLEVSAVASTVDRETSSFDREVKAVTYHDIEIVRRGGRYEVTLILDI